MNMNLWKNQINLIIGSDFFRKIEGSVRYEQVCIIVQSDLYLSTVVSAYTNGPRETEKPIL